MRRGRAGRGRATLFAMRARGIVFAVAVVACGGSATSPPPVADAGLPPTTDTSTRTYAITDVFLGDSTRAGLRSDTAWKSFGWNLDGKITTNTSVDVCTRPPKSATWWQVDGTVGIDNAFGAWVLPLLESVASIREPSAVATAAIQQGARTIQLRVVGAAADGAQRASGLTVGWFPSGAYDAAPFPGFVPTTDWPVSVEGLADGATLAGGPRASFQQASVSNGHVYAEVPGADRTGEVTLDFVVGLGTIEVPLRIHHALIVFTPVSETIGDGLVAGVLDAEELIADFVVAAQRMSPQLCGVQSEGLAEQLRMTADILKDGTNTKGRVCDGISVGLGFAAKAIASPTRVAAPVPKPPAPCP